MRTTAVTGYGNAFGEAVRATVILTDDNEYRIRRGDGSGAILPSLPMEWRTSGDVVSSLALTGEAFNLAAMPWDAIPVHVHAHKGRKASQTFKAVRTLRQFVLHMTGDKALTKTIVDGLLAAYAEEAEAIAA